MMTENNNKFSLKDRLKESLSNVSNEIKVLSKDKVKRDKLKRKTSNWISIVLKYVILLGLGFLIIYPILQQLAVAFRHPLDLNDPLVLWIPKTFSVQNFKMALIGLDYWKSLSNTIILCTFVTLIQVFITGLVGYAFTRLKFWGSKYLFGLVILTIIVPPTTLAIPQLQIFRNLGLYGNPKAIYLLSFLGVGLKSGIFIFLFRQFFRGIPVELEEAALVDGAGPFKVFLRVMIPNARGAIITVSLFSFVWQWNDSYYANLFFGSESASYPVLTTKMESLQYQLRNILTVAGLWNTLGEGAEKNPLFTSMIVNTAALLVMAPLLIGYVFFQRFFIEGVERSGIVG